MSRKAIANNIAFDDGKRLYYVTLHFGKDETTGKRVKTVKTFKSKEDARKALKIHEADRAKQTLVMPTADTVKTYGAHWLDVEKVNLGLKPTSLNTYRNMLKRHIYPFFNDTPLQKIKKMDIERFFDFLRERGLGQNSIRQYYDVLSNLFLSAELSEKIYATPFRAIKPPKLVAYKNQIFNQQQVATLLKAVANDRLEIAIRLAVQLGLRRGECAGLRWCDVDFMERTIDVVNNRTVAGKAYDGTVKSKAGERQLSIPDSLLAVLERVKREQEQDRADFGAAYEDGGYILAYADGKPYAPNHLTLLFRELLPTIGLPHIRFHDLRHTYGSLAILHAPLWEVSKSMGHSRQDITEKIYIQAVTKTKSVAVNAVDKVLQEAMNAHGE